MTSQTTQYISKDLGYSYLSGTIMDYDISDHLLIFAYVGKNITQGRPEPELP